ncbi:MAG: PQQ-binding-like beta-propeller repeat protein, partial [Planctomycetaceae bacterium]
RYTKPGEEPPRYGRNPSLVQARSLGDRWRTSAPMIVGDRVLFTPPEDDTILCFDLVSGEKQWIEPKNEFLYLAGVFDERAVLVGAAAVAALDVETGRTAWSVPIPDGAGRPSGMGVAADGRYYLPLQSGQVWTIDLTNGEIAAKAYLPSGRDPLGNLGLYRGTLVSLSPLGLTSFEQRSTLEDEIRRRKAINPRDALALLREADIRLLGRDHHAALPLLRQIAPDELPEEDRSHYRDAMIDSLTAVIRSDLHAHDAELEELRRFVESEMWTGVARSERDEMRDERGETREKKTETGGERVTAGEPLISQLSSLISPGQLRFRRLSIEQLEARQEYEAAFSLLWDLAAQDGARIVTGDDDPETKLTLRLWLAGRFRDLWDAMPAATRDAIGERIRKRTGVVLTADTAAQEEFVTLFAFHPAAVAVQRQLVETHAAAGELLRA